jgi:hypothetical protein
MLSPLNLISPVRCGHIAFRYVRAVTSLETCSLLFHAIRLARLWLACGACALLSETYGFYGVARLGNDNVRLRGVIGCPLWLVVIGYTDSFQARIICHLFSS